MADILLVDDDPVLLTLVGEILRDDGHRVRTAADGEEGLRQAETRLPDLIILDLYMPKMDGFALARRLKQGPATSAVPIIMLTQHSDGVFDREAHESGCNGFLAKPVDADLLHQMVQLMFEYREPAAATPEDPGNRGQGGPRRN
jgi:CheY-like chemotaxis protein